MKRLAYGLVAIVALAGTALAVRDRAASDPAVPILTVARGAFHAVVGADGELRSQSAVTVSAGRAHGALVVAWLAPEGSQVAAGDVVVEFESHQAREQLQQADAEMRKLEQELRKHSIQVGARRADLTAEATRSRISRDQAAFKANLDDGIVPQVEIAEAKMDLELAAVDLNRVERVIVDQAPKDDAALALLEIRLQKAQNQRDMAATNLAATKVEAAGPGMVTYKSVWKQGGLAKVAPGDSIWPGRPVIDLVDLKQLEFVARVREEDAVRVAEGQGATIDLPALPGVELPGTVRQVAPVAQQIDPRSPLKFVEVKVAIDGLSDRLRAGLTGRVEIAAEVDPDALCVPREAVIEDDDGRWVVVAGSDPVSDPPIRRQVELGSVNDTVVVVTAGLQAGDRIYLRDPTRTAAEIEADRIARQKEARKKRKTTGSGNRRIIMF